MTGRHSGSRVTLTRRSIWRIRLARDTPRYLVSTAAIVGLAASARFALAPPAARVVRDGYGARPIQDRGAEGFAVLFARRYLTWSAAEPDANAQGLDSFAGGSMDGSLGLALPQRGEQRVEWAEVVQERTPSAETHVYTVATQLDSGSLVYLAVQVTRAPEGVLQLSSYPAFVGPPAAGPAQLPRLHEVGDPALTTVITRALRNYMAAAGGELAADLASGARVSLPTVALTLLTVRQIDWAPIGRSVLATVTAADARGGQYTLEYELDVAQQQGRWDVSALETDPNVD
jgi:hypothetical protein